MTSKRGWLATQFTHPPGSAPCLVGNASKSPFVNHAQDFMLWDSWTYVMDQSSNTDIKKGLACMTGFEPRKTYYAN